MTLITYSDLLTVAATVLGKQDPVLTSMANQMEAKVKSGPASNKQEEAAAKALKKNLIELIAARTSSKMAYLQKKLIALQQ